MLLKEIDIIKQMELLKQRRQLFHSEADFQFALAWEIQKSYPEADVRLEYCPPQNPDMHIDIVIFLNSSCFPIELKYKTSEFEHFDNSESFSLKNQGAQLIGRYDCLKDIERIEHLSKVLDNFKQGYVIFLSNDPSYWSLPRSPKPTICDDFRIHDGIIKSGECKWGCNAGGTTKKRESSIDLFDNYLIKWRKFSLCSDSKNGTFKYTIFSICKY